MLSNAPVRCASLQKNLSRLHGAAHKNARTEDVDSVISVSTRCLKPHDQVPDVMMMRFRLSEHLEDRPPGEPQTR